MAAAASTAPMPRPGAQWPPHPPRVPPRPLRHRHIRPSTLLLALLLRRPRRSSAVVQGRRRPPPVRPLSPRRRRRLLPRRHARPPFLARNPNFSAKIYATEVTARIGGLMMEELVAMHSEFVRYYGLEKRQGRPDWMKWEELERLPSN
uniref:Uncharacterized protein n=1 Tax=Ananas comosus var. bracteatus TaxID=296719 RepID=A0A6V7PRL5_ANACO|nr:unnamed protein product [Ananas comosus var. bracteatus]